LIRLIRPSARALACILALGAQAACRSEPRACPPPASTAAWGAVQRGAVSFRLPPGYAPDTAARPPLEAGADFASWSVGPPGKLGPAGRIALVVGRDVPAPELPPGDGGPARGTLCTLASGKQRATVASVELADGTSATGRAYQTIARWEPRTDGRAAALFMVAETPAEQRRQLAAAASLRIR
jgi:hypothetical protein